MLLADQGRGEVDFVIYGSDAFVAIEVKNSARLDRRHLRSLNAFCGDFPESRTLLLYRGADSRRVDGILCIPVEQFLRELVPGVPLPH